ncbi:unnamed protein product [Brassica rapa]|uniref:Uncharacterized protein n=1 Tax=Brassica campestris TaxID=3711 RepID=A0A3P6BC48_BRACM|nr:unnamed protein product [Brassica rapa]VDD03657.1 unnamed protein product [Brassica rapa]
MGWRWSYIALGSEVVGVRWTDQENQAVFPQRSSRRRSEEESGCERHLEAWRSRVEPVNYEGSRDFLSSPTMKQYSGVKKLEPVSAFKEGNHNSE